MYKYALIAAALLISGCTVPTPEKECKDSDAFTTDKDMEACLVKYSDSLKTELRMLELKIQYECPEAKLNGGN